MFEAFKSLNIEVIHQFQIDIYRVDFYIPEYNMVIEYDEDYHRNTYYQDRIRENKIKEKINCSFIRCNAKDKDVKNIMKILNHIFIFKPKIPKKKKKKKNKNIRRTIWWFYNRRGLLTNKKWIRENTINVFSNSSKYRK